jgi:hypothetical protein
MLKQRFTKLSQIGWLLIDVAYSKFDISTSHKEKNWTLTLSNLKERGKAYLRIYSSLACPGNKLAMPSVMVSN